MDSLLFVVSSLSVFYFQRRRRRSESSEAESDNNINVSYDRNVVAFDNNNNNISSYRHNIQQSLQDGTSLDAKERVCTVSEDNIPTPNGHLRSEMRLQNLWHRATYILIKHGNNNKNNNSGGGSTSNNNNLLQQQQILVQQRSNLKDYYPGKLDPVPGGVVGYGESYEENAIREIQEEMGIDVSDGNPYNNTLQRLFTFQFSNDQVKVWGDFYEVQYDGSLEDIKIQESEVSQIISMTMEQLQDRIIQTPNDFIPDSIYAMKLYFQRQTDMRVKRRLLHGYSSGNLDDYAIRPKPKVVFFDCDDTLYFDGWKTAGHLTRKIEQWCVEKVGLPPGKAYELYKQHGTALKGLLAEGLVENNPESIDNFLKEVHDIPINELLKPDTELRELLLQMDPSVPKYIFTASVSHHAERCLQALGIDDLFERVIIDVKKCDLETKHHPKSFEAAMKIANVDDPEACIFLDDNRKNIEAARSIGWRSVLVGTVGRDCGTKVSSDHAELEIDRIHDMPTALPELFDGMN